MAEMNLSPELIQQTTDFHGHWCPGLALGIRAAEWAMREIGRAYDEEVVTVVETDMCGVDAIQFLTGCTFGKGNLIYRDHGKNAFTFYRRRDGKAARLVLRPEVFGEDGQVLGKLNAKMQTEGLTADEEQAWKDVRAAISGRVMEIDFDRLYEVKEASLPAPKKARLLTTLVCESCGEPVMETRTRRFRDRTLCIPCFEAEEKRF